ncbi:MAG: hypothetical protein J6T67_09775 [Paludibacteraceae bacterium]|nr:hypothetical protein [Paludibacteraceae bacterium]
MEQLKQLGGRLLGKKCVAVILGLLGLCGPSSLWAEKLDTTFVLDMVIDNTPCYYTKYDSTGNITATGRYTPSDYFRINTGYVTDGEGRIIDTLVYACDKVTRQWNKIEIARKDSFYTNGMLWFKDYEVSYSSAHPYYLPDSLGNERFKSSETFFSYSMSGYYKENRLFYRTEADAHGSHVVYTTRSIIYEYDSYGNLRIHDNTENIMPTQMYPAVYDTYNNEYDDNNNLVSYILVRNKNSTWSSEEKMSYVYDEYNRRVKEIRYLPVNPYSDSIEWMFQDSTVYVYESVPLTHPHISSLMVNEKSVRDFEGDLLVYCFDMEYNSDIVSYELPEGVTATESFDDSTNILTVRLTSSGTDGTVEYKLHFRPVEDDDDSLDDDVTPLTLPYISSLTIDEELVSSFSADNYYYWFDTEYNPDVVSYTLPDGVTATESFDDSTNVLSIRLATDNTSEMVEYKLHFRPVNGVDDFLGDQVNLYVMDKAICIDGATEPIHVYNLLGTLVGTGRGEEIRIPMRQTGVYVVKTGGKAAKVIVK